MEKFLSWLDDVIKFEDSVIKVKPRISNTIGSAVKILTAAKGANLGNTERAVIERLSSIAEKAQALVA